MDIKHEIYDIRNLEEKKILFLDISSTNTDTLVQSLESHDIEIIAFVAISTERFGQAPSATSERSRENFSIQF
jgi:hypothetical protein